MKSQVHKSDCPYIICGDFNVLEKDHHPHYSVFRDWEYAFYDYLNHLGFLDAFRVCHPNDKEYSWVGRTNNGYRYDHCFFSKELAPNIIDCCYHHETRQIPITDHSAMSVILEIENCCT